MTTAAAGARVPSAVGARSLDDATSPANGTFPDDATSLVDAASPGDASSLAGRVAQAAACFARAGIAGDETAADAEVLARHVLGWDRAAYLARRRDPAPPGFEARYAPLAARRRKREPVSLITGCREFRGLTFAVGPAVLTPRPETEAIVETALALFGGRREATLTIADVGTGSGCLAVTLAREFPRAAVTAVDISPDALAVARANAAAHGVADRIAWVAAPLTDWLAGAATDGAGAVADRGSTVADGGRARIDLLVANLPYVPTSELASLPPEVRLHEPRTALDGGSDGLDPLRELLAGLWPQARPPRSALHPAPAPRQTAPVPRQAASAGLKPDARVLVEIGLGQADAFRRLVAATPGAELLLLRPDLQGIPRTAVIAAARP